VSVNLTLSLGLNIHNYCEFYTVITTVAFFIGVQLSVAFLRIVILLLCFRANPKSNKLAIGRKKFNMDPKKVRIYFHFFSLISVATKDCYRLFWV